jgi:beta-galactosidase
MKRITISLLIILCAFINVKAQTKTTSVTKFNDDWQFIKDADTSISPILFKHTAGQKTWQNISLPHTVNIEPVIKTVQQWQGISLYRKFFALSNADKGKHIAIRLDAAMSEADIYLNGKHLLNHKGGYLPIYIDVTDAALYGRENCLLVRLNNQDNPVIPPGKAIKDLDFNFYSGIYRNAWLIKKNKLYITDAVQANHLNGGGVALHYDLQGDKKAVLHIKTEVQNDGMASLPTQLKATLYDPTGRVVKTITSGIKSVKQSTNTTFEQDLDIADPSLWSTAHPQLYKLLVEVVNGGQVIDSTSIKTGIRQIAFKSDGFYLNGSKYTLRGTNRHQEYPYVGYAISDNAQYRDAYKIKEAGFDFVRCSHYPPSPAFLNACDELGILVMDSTPGWQFFGDDEFQKNSLQNITDMIHRDRNHPSIVLWESSLNETQMSHEYMQKANAIVHTELPYGDIYTCGWIDDVYDVFIPARQHAKAPDYWKKYTKKPILIAEYGDWEYYAQNAGFNQTAYQNLTAEEKTSRQLRGDGPKRMLQQALNYQESHNDNQNGLIVGDANWLMFDYKRGYAADIESSGIMDIYRLPKYAFYFYQSQRAVVESKPMLFIASAGNDPNIKAVKIFSNCDEVELFANGKSLGKQLPDTGAICNHLKHPPFTFKLDQPVSLTAKGYVGGKEVITTISNLPGSPYQISLRVDYSGKKLSAGQNDIAFVYASVVDKNGTVVPDATNSIKFLVNGVGALIGDSTVKAEAGIATFLIKAGDKKGTITLQATSGKLNTGSLAVNIE